MVQNGCNGSQERRVLITDMRLLWLALFATLASAAETRPILLTYDASGTLIGRSHAVLRHGGYAFVPRESLYGARAGAVLDEQDRMHPVLWITGEDADAGVAEIWVGAQAPKGPDNTSEITSTVRLSGHVAKRLEPKESGAFGMISRLECETKDDESEPLFDEHGLFAGWHATKVVDGSRLSFAVPLERLEVLHRTMHSTLQEWNEAHDARREAAYTRALGHLWAEDFHGALFYFRKAVEDDSSNPRAWLHLGFVEGKNGHTRVRAECYRKAIDLDPNLAEARYLLGVSLLLGGDQEGAEQQLEALKKLDKTFAARLQQFVDALHVDRMDHMHKIKKLAQKNIV